MANLRASEQMNTQKMKGEICMSNIFSEMLRSDDSDLAANVSRQFQDDPYLSLKKEKKKGKKKSKKIKKLSKKQKKQKEELKRLKELNRLREISRLEELHESQKNQQTSSPVQNLQSEYYEKILTLALNTGLRQMFISSLNPTSPEKTTHSLTEGRDIIDA